MKLQVKPLKSLVKQADDGVLELAKLDVIERDATAVIEQVLEDGAIENLAEQQKLSNARLRLDLVPSRRKKLLAEQPRIIREMCAEAEVCQRTWNDAVRSHCDQLRAQAAEALKPFFPGAERALKDVMKTLWLPVVHKAQKWQWYDAGLPADAPASARIDWVRDGLARMQRYADKVGVELDC
jgi:hypothetical protein